MTDFVIVIAAATALAGPAALSPAVPVDAPTLGFRTYADAISCEAAAAMSSTPPGKRLVCVPTEPYLLETANAH